jgi:hypothetical protein
VVGSGLEGVGEAVIAAAANAPEPALVPALHEVLTGELANCYGALPMVMLPADDELLIKFVHSIASHLQGKAVYRRDYVVVIPDEEKRRIRVLSANAFCSWSQHHVVTSKIKHDANGQPYTVVKDIPGELAKKVLESPDFTRSLREIEEIHAVPLPATDGLSIMEPGFREGIYTFAFE